MGDFGKATTVSFDTLEVFSTHQGCRPDDFFGDGSDGDADISTTTTWTPDANNYIKKQFRTFRTTANITASADAKLMLVCVQGDAEIAGGSLNMDWRGIDYNGVGDNFARGLFRGLRSAVAKRFSDSLAKLFNSPNVGASGGVGAASADPGASGSAGVNGQTGGGGAGNSRGSSARGGHGGAGTATTGGSGGGGVGYNSGYTQGGDATKSGPGGNGGSSGGGGWGSTGGAGNNPGVDSNVGAYADPAWGGGGGLLIVLVGGTLRVASGAKISSAGSRGTNTTQANYAYCGGGAGGGRVIVLARKIVNDGTISADGGAGGQNSGPNYSAGGAGGAGSVDIAEIG